MKQFNISVLAILVVTISAFFNLCSVATADYLVADTYAENLGNPPNRHVLRYRDDGTYLGDANGGVFIGPANSGGLNGAIGMVFDPAGNLFVSSNFTNQVIRFDGTTGAPNGSGGTSFSTNLDGPSQIGFNPSIPGNLLVANLGNALTQSFTGNSITQFDANGNSLGSFTSGSPALMGVSSFAFAPNGELYVGSFLDGSIYRFTSTGSFIAKFGTDQFLGASGLRFEGNDLWVSSSFVSTVSRITPNGTATTFSTGANTNPGFTAATTDGSGDILVGLTAAGGIYRFSSSGQNLGAFIGLDGSGLAVAGAFVQVASIPEPASGLLLAGGVTLTLMRRRKH